jgi:hypothetical protein
MAHNLGTAIIDFGAFPGSNEASVSVPDPTITAGARVEAFVMGDDTAGDHTANDHRYFPALASVTCGTPNAGVGFPIYGRSVHKMQGSFNLRWVWTDGT